MLEDVKIKRDASITLFPFKDFFQGFENLEAVKKIFGKKTAEVLDELKVEIYSGRRGYMGVDNGDGHIRINYQYLKDGEERSIYLDVIHELVHVRQHTEGKELFDENYAYVNRPTEIEAYQAAVNEARIIGMSEEEIFGYLEMDSIKQKDHERLARHLGVALPKKRKKKR